jgi:hypothetical protein
MSAEQNMERGAALCYENEADSETREPASPPADPPAPRAKSPPPPARPACDFCGKVDCGSPPYEGFAYLIQMTADALASRYGGPLYLVGGALKDKTPNDYDVRVIMSEADLTRLFGPDDSHEPRDPDAMTTPRKWRILREELKRSRRLARHGLPFVDFQIQGEAEAKFYEDQGKPRVRLDRAPEGFFEAGKGEG